ncbi:hypothetical protein GC163_17080 [bacterium]|nr:hypothetical protein [bacterium]
MFVTFPSLRMCVLLGLLFPMTGCGGSAPEAPTGTVSGTITIKESPLTAGRVNFVASTGGASGFADLASDGTYSIPGRLPVGDYSVYLSPVGLGDAPPSENPAQDKPTPLEGVDKKYLDPATTDLKASVQAGKNSFPFDLQP